MCVGTCVLFLIVALLCGCNTSEPPRPEGTPAPSVSATKTNEPAARVDSSPSTVPASPTPAHQAAQGALGNLPLAFEENQGQFDQQALFAARHGTGTFFFTANSMAAVFTRSVKTAGEDTADLLGEPDGPGRDTTAATENFALKIHFPGASAEVLVEGEEPLEGRVSYFRGKDPKDWVSGATTFGRIVYRDLWPGIDLIYSGSAGRLNAEYRLTRAASVGQIRLRYEGQEALRLDQRGRLVIVTPWGNLHEETPRATQHDRPVEIAYTLAEATGEVGFVLENTDPDGPLVINP